MLEKSHVVERHLEKNTCGLKSLEKKHVGFLASKSKRHVGVELAKFRLSRWLNGFTIMVLMSLSFVHLTEIGLNPF